MSCFKYPSRFSLILKNVFISDVTTFSNAKRNRTKPDVQLKKILKFSNQTKP